MNIETPSSVQKFHELNKSWRYYLLPPPSFRVAGDTLPADGVSTKDSSLSPSGISSSFFSRWRVLLGQKDTQGWLLLLSLFSKQCCFLAFFIEQLVFFKDRVECPSENVKIL